MHVNMTSIKLAHTQTAQLRCRELGVDVLIDDNPVYAVECAQAGINVLLYDWQLTYPWSKTADG